MRYVSIDLSSDNYLEQPQIFGGYAGEHNETILQVTLPQRIIGTKYSGYRFDFQSSEDNEISSPLIPISELKDGVLSFKLSEQLTIAGKLFFNVVATLLNGDTVSLTSKTNMVALYIGDSPEGNVQLVNPNGYKDELLAMIDERASSLNKAEDGNSEIYGDKETNIAGTRAFVISKATRELQSDKSYKYYYWTDGATEENLTAITNIVNANETYSLWLAIDSTGGNVFNDSLGKVLGVNIEENKLKIQVTEVRATDNPISFGGRTWEDDEIDFTCFGDYKSYIRFPSNPELGTEWLESWAFVTGFDNKGLGKASNVGGAGNTADGAYGAVFGRNNYGVFTSLMGGRNNKVLAKNGFAAGEKNTVSGYDGAALGGSNQALRDYTLATGKGTVAEHVASTTMGTGTRTTRGNQTVLGQFNDITNKNALLIVGNGDSDTNRSNAFVVNKDGSADIKTQGANETSVVTLSTLNETIGDINSILATLVEGSVE